MKNSKLKLSLSIIAIILAVILLTIGIVVSLIGFKYNWNTMVDIKHVPKDVELSFEAKVNQNTFSAYAKDGAFNNPSWYIPEEETTFSPTKQTIQIQFKFTNKCMTDLQIVISGIHFDQKNRFETYLTDENNMRIDDHYIVKQADGTGLYTFTVLGEYDAYQIVNLNYRLIEPSVNIAGDEGDKQIISINISEAGK